MQSSIAKLAGNMCKADFKHTTKYFDNNITLMLRKGVYPYKYMTDVSKFKETKLPSKKDFEKILDSGMILGSGNELQPEPISDEDYSHAQDVFNTFKCQNLGEYTGLYCKSDVLILADIWESFVNVCLKKYQLDPSHYITAPSLAMDAMLKMTDVELELLTDNGMYLFFEEGIRGGISMITGRYSKANNPYMGADCKPD